MLKTKNLTKRYGKTLAVDNLNMHVKKGSVYGLLGMNGAGKTTTLGMISALIRPTKGDIIVDGHSIKNNVQKVKDSIGLLAQDASFYGTRTVWEHMKLYAMLKGAELNQAIDLLNEVGLWKRKNSKIKELSHGMLKMLNLSQAMLGNPKLILLDEPLSGLDPGIRHNVRNIIRKYSKSSTILISSHNLDEIERLCSHIGIIHNGQLKLEDRISRLKEVEHVIEFKLLKIPEDLLNSLENKNIIELKKKENMIKIRTKKDISSELLGILLKKKVDILAMKKGISVEDIFFSSIK